MASKPGKFAALADLRNADAEITGASTKAEEQPEAAPVAVAQLPRGRGRPPGAIGGKRSHPDFKLYSHYLKRKTQRAAMARLLAEDSGRDLSDVLQELLEGWLRE